VAPVSPFLLAASSTCRHTTHTIMHAGGIGWGYVKKETQLENSFGTDLF